MTHTVNEQHPFRDASRTCQGPFLSIEFGEPGHVWTSFGRLERRAQIQRNLFLILFHRATCAELRIISVHCQYLSLLLSSALLVPFQRVAWLWKNEHRYIPTHTRVVPETETNCTISFPTCYLQNTHGTSVENGSRSWDVSIIRAHFNLSRRLTSP